MNGWNSNRNWIRLQFLKNQNRVHKWTTVRNRVHKWTTVRNRVHKWTTVRNRVHKLTAVRNINWYELDIFDNLPPIIVKIINTIIKTFKKWKSIEIGYLNLTQ